MAWITAEPSPPSSPSSCVTEKTVWLPSTLVSQCGAPVDREVETQCYWLPYCHKGGQPVLDDVYHNTVLLRGLRHRLHISGEASQ